MEEKKENNATQQPLSYEEALKAFKAQWAGKRKEEKKLRKEEERKAQREADVVIVKKVLEVLEAVTPASKDELSAVFTRLNMFVEGKRYTRNMSKTED